MPLPKHANIQASHHYHPTIESRCFVTDKEGMFLQTICTLIVIIIRLSILTSLVLFKMDQTKTMKLVFSRSNFKALVLSYLSISALVSSNVLICFLLARYLSTSECEW